MKNMRSMVFVTLAVAVLCGVVRLVVPNRPAPPEAARKSAGATREARSARPRNKMRSVEPRVMTPTTRQRLSSGEDQAGSAQSEAQADAGTQKAAQAGTSEKKVAPASVKTPKAAGTTQGTPPAQDVLQDPVARVALAFVGADPDAEMYWYEAINNPSLSAHERQDLIEDLNEDGLSDPRNPTADDLPLILNRIQIIEDVIWDAMDEVNTDAFLEAYKDLVNLAFLAMEN